MLAFPRSLGAYSVHTDACNRLIRCVFLQKHHDRTDKPIGVQSRLWNNAKCAYDKTHSKYLAVSWTVLLPRPYLEGSWFNVGPEHNALKRIRNLTDSAGRTSTLATTFVRVWARRRPLCGYKTSEGRRALAIIDDWNRSKAERTPHTYALHHRLHLPRERRIKSYLYTIIQRKKTRAKSSGYVLYTILRQPRIVNTTNARKFRTRATAITTYTHGPCRDEEPISQNRPNLNDD